MNQRSTHNQDAGHYSKEYYLNDCAGAEKFVPGIESEHLLYKYIFEYMKIDVVGKSVLDVGCGRGELCLSSARRGADFVCGLDFSQDAVDLANDNRDAAKDVDQSKVVFIQGNALELNLDKKFDVIFLTDIIEHLYDDQNEILFSKVNEHLSDNGVVVIHTMPTKEFLYFGQWMKYIFNKLRGRSFSRLTFQTQAEITHVNLFHKEQLARLMKDFDYKIWYDFADMSFSKRVLSKTPLVRLLSGNLWAIGKKKAR